MTNQPSRIFYAEDSEEIAFLVRAILEREGYDVDHVENGRVGVEYVAANPPPDLAILDIMMPYLDGFQLVREIRARPDWDRVPVLMVSAKAREADIERALALGADDYIVKPFSPVDLVARTRRMLETGRVARS